MPKLGYKSITVSENVYKRSLRSMKRIKKVAVERHCKFFMLPYKYDGGDDDKR
jgi:hypothetical protein